MPFSAVAPTHCPTCGKVLMGTPAGGDGHCSRCLFRITFGDEDEAPPAEVASAPWMRLSGCELFEELGRGGMGVVYRARQKALDRIVAVKVLLRANFAGPEERERFHREARAAARLKHPGIVGIFDVGEEDGTPWFSMEYIPGESLERVVREHPMDALRAARCVREVALAVQHAHEHGVLHCDLKPSNIVLDDDGAPRVTDFGIARIVATGAASERAAELTRPGHALGSPSYAAPEQAFHGRVEARTDVYGLGALLYHLLTGRPPFQAATVDAILAQLRESDPLAPRRLNPGVPRDLETICLKCLCKTPDGRYATAAEVADDLRRFAEGRPILARPLGPLGKGWRWARRHPGIAALLALIFALVVGLVGGALGFARHQARMEHRSSLLAEARTLRQSRLAGGRDDALRALQAAWAIAPASEIRDDVVACLALPEIGFPRRVELGMAEAMPPDPSLSADGRRVARFEGGEGGGEIVVRELASGIEIGRLAGQRAGSLLKLDDHGERLAICAPGGGVLAVFGLAERRLLFTCEHPLPLSSVDWSGDLIATGCENRFIYIWDDRGRLRHRMSGHQAVPVRVSFRPGGQELCSTARDPYVRVWQAARGVEIVRRESEHPAHTALWWSADGRTLLAGLEDGGAQAYGIDWSRCVEVLAPPQEEPHTENLGSADFSADGRFAAVVDEDVARVWDFEAGRLVATLPKDTGQWLSALFAPQGDALWVCGWAHELTRYPLGRNALGAAMLGEGEPSQGGLGHLLGNLLRDVSADGRKLVLSNNGTGQFMVVTPASGGVVRLAHPGTLGTAISPDGSWVVTSSYLAPGLRVWSLPEGKLQRVLCETDIVMQTLITPDGGRLIARTSGGNRVFRTAGWAEEPRPPTATRFDSITASPDGRVLATVGDNEVRLLRADNFEEIVRLTPPAQAGWLGEAHPVFNGDGGRLLIHTALGSVVRWDLRALRAELIKLGMGDGLVVPMK